MKVGEKGLDAKGGKNAEMKERKKNLLLSPTPPVEEREEERKRFPSLAFSLSLFDTLSPSLPLAQHTREGSPPWVSPRALTEKRSTSLLAFVRFRLRRRHCPRRRFSFSLDFLSPSPSFSLKTTRASAKMATPAAPPTDGNKPSRTWKLSLSGPLVLERVLLAAGFVVLVIVNVAAGASNRRVSDRFSTPITPAGWAFSIWGLIFFLQAVGVVYAAIPWGYGRDDLDGGAKGRHVAAVALPWFCGVREVSGPFFWSEGSESELQKEKEGEKGREKEGEKGRKKEGEKGRKKGEKDRKEAHPRLFACPYQKKLQSGPSKTSGSSLSSPARASGCGSPSSSSSRPFAAWPGAS